MSGGTGVDEELEGSGFQIIEADDDAEESKEDEAEGPVVEMGSKSLVKRGSVTLADEAGEWVKAKEDKDKKRFDARSRDLYQAFVREATSYERLSEEEERALGFKVRDHEDKGAAQKLVVHNLRLAIKMAHQYRRAWANLMDLVQEASTGMAIAAQKWDPEQGTRYGTYAAYWIRAQLTKFLMTNGRLIHTGNTRAGRKLFHQLPRIRRQLLAAGQQPTIDAIANEVNETPEEVARIVQRLDAREASLSAPVGDEAGSTLGDMIAGEGYDPEVGASQREMQSLMEKMIARFSQTLTDERDIAIWGEHLLSTEPTSLVALGKRFGVSKQRMGQLATRLKRSFRRHIIDELGPEASLRWLFDRE